MLKKNLSGLLVLILVCTFGRISTWAQTPAEFQSELTTSRTAVEHGILVDPEVQPNAKLKADMQMLLADAKAGKVIPAARPQIQPAKSNNLSKGAKIAIGVGIAVIVLAIIINHERNHLFDCKSRCVI
jgi:hypothetical protein